VNVVYKSPTKLLKELGITEPHEIDIEAIAQHCGATIIYEPLQGCEARILGNGDRAIITVNATSSLGRKRFSAGHELGHWMRDRGRIGFACTEQVITAGWRSKDAEQGANEYAADLLLPVEMFRRESRNQPITFETADRLSDVFATSLTATAIRLVQHGSFPAIIICLENGKRKWFIRGDDVPESIWPHETPRLATIASDLIRGKPGAEPTPIQADGWISHPRSKWCEVVEHSLKISPSIALTLLWWKDEKQLVDLDEGC